LTKKNENKKTVTTVLHFFYELMAANHGTNAVFWD